MVKKDFPKVHFYDQDLVALYDETWILIRDFWKKGTSASGLHSRYFAHPDGNRINQFNACFATFFLVYSNRIYPVFPLLDNFYAKQEPSGAIRGEYGEKDGKPIRTKDNPKGVLPAALRLGRVQHLPQAGDQEEDPRSAAGARAVLSSGSS